jgi:hypothetical protein
MAQPTNDSARADPMVGVTAAVVVAVPLMSLRPADSPRLNGEDKAHIARLSEIQAPLPPILVDRSTMRVIDGMHRLMAASLQGRKTIDVIFFDGSESDVFLRGVQENVAHGLPLSLADRRAAAERIIISHPHMSDRALSHSTGLAAKTVAAIRKSSSEKLPQSNTRVGRDGRTRPLDSGAGRRRAAQLLTQLPEASLRDVARVVGLSPATVLDVRKRLARGEPPVPERIPASAARRGAADTAGQATAGGSDASVRAIGFGSRKAAPPDPAVAVEKLLRDPSLRNERGKKMLQLLHANAAGAEQLPDAAAALPPHCLAIVMQLARQYAAMWQAFARELDGRARIIDALKATR